MRSVVLACLLAAGCDQVFGIQRTMVAPDGPPPPVFVQLAANEAGVDSLDATFPMPVTAGHIVVAGVYVENALISTVGDSQHNTFQLAFGPVAYVPTNGNMYIYYATALQTGPDTLTTTGPNGTTDLLVMAHEYSNVTTFESANGMNGDNQQMDGMTSGEIQATGSNHLIFGFGIAETAAAGMGFVTRSSFDSNITEDELVEPAGLYFATATNTGADGRWTMLGAALRGL